MSVLASCSRISRVTRDLRRSGIREFFDIVSEMTDVISLGVGEPDFDTPWHICDHVVNTLRRGQTSYTSNYGLPELRQEIATMTARDWGVDYDWRTQILITHGVSEALDLALRALLDPGDEVMVPEPCYVSYAPCVEMAYGVSVPVVCQARNEFKLLPADVEAAVTPRTKALMIAFPSNPTGAVMTRDELAALAEIAQRHDLVVISDEIYDRLTYEGTHTCFASLPGMTERTILLNGFSKAYAMTGWRLGYACAPPDLLDAMMKIHQYTALCASRIAQNAALEALRSGETARRKMVHEYNQRRRMFVHGLNEIGWPCPEPKGAFYVFPSIGHTGMTSSDFARDLLFEQKVAAVPGSAFGESGEGHIRCTYATGTDNLREALRRIERFLTDRGIQA